MSDPLVANLEAIYRRLTYLEAKERDATARLDALERRMERADAEAEIASMGKDGRVTSMDPDKSPR